jgi:hypothetical protein
MAFESAARELFGSPFNCPAPVEVGHVVYFSGANTVDIADSSNPAKMPAIGIVVAKAGSVVCIVQHAGECDTVSGLTPGTTYYVTSTGTLTSNPAGLVVVQAMGKARDSGLLLMYPTVEVSGGGGGGGVLNIAGGGTNSAVALNNNRIMVSSGGAIVESAALTNGQVLLGSTGAAPVAASLTAGANITLTPGPGSLTIAATGGGGGGSGTNGTATGTGVSAVESSTGEFHQTVLTLVDTPVPLFDNPGVVACGGLPIYNFPEGGINFLGAVANLGIKKSSIGVIDAWNGDFSLGSVGTPCTATLTGTAADLIPSTITPQGIAPGISRLFTADDTTDQFLVPGHGFTPTGFGPIRFQQGDGTLPTGVNSVSYYWVIVIDANNIQVATSKANALALIPVDITDAGVSGASRRIRGVGETTAKGLSTSTEASKVFDGTAAPLVATLNVLVDDTDQDVTTNPCDFFFSGTVVLSWVFLGDIT